MKPPLTDRRHNPTGAHQTRIEGAGTLKLSWLPPTSLIHGGKKHIPFRGRVCTGGSGSVCLPGGRSLCSVYKPVAKGNSTYLQLLISTNVSHHHLTVCHIDMVRSLFCGGSERETSASTSGSPSSERSARVSCIQGSGLGDPLVCHTEA